MRKSQVGEYQAGKGFRYTVFEDDRDPDDIQEIERRIAIYQERAANRQSLFVDVPRAPLKDKRCLSTKRYAGGVRRRDGWSVTIYATYATEK